MQNISMNRQPEHFVSNLSVSFYADGKIESVLPQNGIQFYANGEFRFTVKRNQGLR